VTASLLSFSRQDKTEAAFEPYDLHAGIDTTLEIMRYEFREGVEIQKHYERIPQITAHKSEINQVVFNILNNAIQAIRERGENEKLKGLITIRTGVCGNNIFCEMENNGTPITQENGNRLFELFFTTKPENWGTGLGLNISKNIIEQRHNGKLLLVSLNPVVFRIELPIPNNR